MIRQTVVSATALMAVVASFIVAPAASATSTGAEVLELPAGESRIVVIDESVADADAVAEAVTDAVDGSGDTSTVLDEIGAIVAPLDDAAADVLEAIPGVDVVDDELVTIGATSTQSNAPWNLSRLDQQFLPVDSAYAYPTAAGTGVRVYVIDSGVTPNASQFGNRLLAGATAVNDNRGSSDCNGHGTHVAGSVASSSWGVAKQALIVPVRVFDCSNSANLSTVLTAIDWVITNHPAGTPGVINMSLSGGQNVEMNLAVREATAAGLIVVAAAGNANRDACVESPASAPEALTVGATTIQDARASFSNFGPCLDIFAPGENIISVDNDSLTNPVLMSGTSMAAPHVAGAAALLWSTMPGASARSVESALVGQAFTGRVTSTGTGSPNRLLSSLAVDTTLIPGAVSGVSATAQGETSAKVSWKAPTVNADKVTDYTIQFRRIGTSTWLTASDGVSTATFATISGLQANTVYDVRVRGESFTGSGPFSSLATVQTRTGQAPAGAVPVYRFWSSTLGAHFFTASATERDHVIRTYPKAVWNYEGVAFGAYSTQVPGTVPVFRFWSETHGAHFYTASQAERDQVLRLYPRKVWAYEGIAYYAFPEKPTAFDTFGVDRFWSPSMGAHFFTASKAESDTVRRIYPSWVWTYEGTRFYVPTTVGITAPR
ncbi:subtilisin family serine protease [Microcella putealis]|uniref:Subtilisin family serine protease n=1 Tax=Microcella putealis TaxID=337005 RepID=A0A4Q7LSW6_9MICO|nr:S8 family serine peptidase [Microcella putealis]RZS57422.1 subtilisin family serine protease [Microcella putealis]TQM19435.1 subtilisin family serine protease [Microcella putealis]